MKYYYLWLVSVWPLLMVCSCSGDDKNPTCQPGSSEGCGNDQICRLLDAEQTRCVPICDPNAGPSCESGELCFGFADGTAACMPTCDPEKDDVCLDKWTCAPYRESFLCRAECTLTESTCDSGEVCQPMDSNVAICMPQCDPLDESTCSEGTVCEIRTDGKHACYPPLIFTGIVFDSTTTEPIESAHVIAADAVGSAATDVSLTAIDGTYELQIPLMRNPDGTFGSYTFSLRVSAQDYVPYPHGLRPAIPLDTSSAVREDERWVLQNAATDVALIPLPDDQKGLGSISGSVVPTDAETPAGGVLVVVEGTNGSAPIGFSDTSGTYTVFNVPTGSVSVHGYRAHIQLTPVTVSLSKGEHLDSVDLIEDKRALSTVSGSINIVNPGEGDASTVVLVPQSTFNATFAIGEVPPGLRAPAPPQAPSIKGAFEIKGVPDGDYVVLAALENDLLVRDPDPNIAGTQIVKLHVPQGTSTEIVVDSSFKVTGALRIVSPGAALPEAINGNPKFIFRDDSSEDKYSLVVYDAFGNVVFNDENVPKVTGSTNVEVPYAGPPLQPGMYYQFRATSWRKGGPISTTEDLLGVFYLPAGN